MAKIFLSYRRGDSANVTGRIDDRLIAEFGRDNVFKDIDSIPLGVDFRTHLRHAVSECEMVLVVIGDGWLNAKDDQGNLRIQNETDFVHIEVETALKRGIPVVPVLLGNAAMPAAHELPEPLRELAFRNATRVRPDPDFHRDMSRILSAISAGTPLTSPADKMKLGARDSAANPFQSPSSPRASATAPPHPQTRPVAPTPAKAADPPREQVTLAAVVDDKFPQGERRFPQRICVFGCAAGLLPTIIMAMSFARAIKARSSADSTVEVSDSAEFIVSLLFISPWYICWLVVWLFVLLKPGKVSGAIAGFVGGFGIAFMFSPYMLLLSLPGGAILGATWAAKYASGLNAKPTFQIS